MFQKLEMQILSSLSSVLSLNLEQSRRAAFLLVHWRKDYSRSLTIRARKEKGPCMAYVSPSRLNLWPQIMKPTTTAANSLPRLNFGAVQFWLLLILCASPLLPCCFQPRLTLARGKPLVLLVSCRQGKVGGGWVSPSIRKPVLLARL